MRKKEKLWMNEHVYTDISTLTQSYIHTDTYIQIRHVELLFNKEMEGY